MKSLKKYGTAALCLSLSAALAGCTPSIGANTVSALTVDGYEVPAGMFIYYTIQGYNEAADIVGNQNGGAEVKAKDVRNSNIDSISSTDWIQDKATEYCVEFTNIMHEYDAIGAELTQEEKEQAADMAEYYYNMNPMLAENGVSLDSMLKMAENTYKEQAVFEYYYGFDGPDGCSEEELKDYFDENYARVKYVAIRLTDDDGEKVSADVERKLRNMADKYVKQINAKSSELDKMLEVNAVQEDYDEYVASQTTTADGEDEVTTTTTTTTAAPDETTETTTTNPYESERLIQKNTTTAASEAGTMDSATESADDTESAEETEDEKNSRLFNEFIFNELPLGEAKAYDYSDDTIYVVIRGDLRERMTEDDYWSESYINNLRSQRYYENFTEKLDAKAEQLSVEKNKSAYRRYEPFKLVLENEA